MTPGMTAVSPDLTQLGRNQNLLHQSPPIRSARTVGQVGQVSLRKSPVERVLVSKEITQTFRSPEISLPGDGRLLQTVPGLQTQESQKVSQIQAPSWPSVSATADLAAVASASFNEFSRKTPSATDIPLSQVAAAKLPSSESLLRPQESSLLRILSSGCGGLDIDSGGDAPSAEELPPWKPSKVIPAPLLADLDQQMFSESPEPKEICWTPSFKSLARLPDRQTEELVEKEVKQVEQVEEVEEVVPEILEAPVVSEPPVVSLVISETPVVSEIPVVSLAPPLLLSVPSMLVPSETKPSRTSMAPTVHDAVCEDGFDSENEEERLETEDDAEQAQESQATDSTDMNETMLREISDLRAALQKERAEKDELAALQKQTAERLNTCEVQMAQQVAQMEQELKKSRAERDALRRRLQETAEQHVELTKRLRKQQELNKSLDKDLNKAESKRRELQNKFEQFRLEMDQAQIDKSLELDSSSISRDSPEVLPPEENFEEELPTAGGLLREWANVYEDPGISSESLDTEWRLQKPIPGRWEVEASPPKESKEEAVTHNQGGGLSMRDLSEIKALKKPPPPVRMLMEVCCLLFQIEPVKTFDERARKRIDYWEPARRYLLSDPFLLSKLRSKQDLEPAQRAKIQKYFKDPNFTSERVLKCSKAAYELYACVSSLAKGPRESEL